MGTGILELGQDMAEGVGVFVTGFGTYLEVIKILFENYPV